MCIAVKISYKIRQETVCYNLKCVYKSYWVTLPLTGLWGGKWEEEVYKYAAEYKYAEEVYRYTEEKQDHKSKSVT